MALDVPVVNYGSRKKKEEDFKNPTKKQMQDFYERWKANRGGKSFAGQKLTVDEIFNS